MVDISMLSGGVPVVVADPATGTAIQLTSHTAGGAAGPAGFTSFTGSPPRQKLRLYMDAGPGIPDDQRRGLTLTDELTHEICRWVMSRRPLAQNTARPPAKPSLNTINNWRHTNDIFAKRFSQARDIGFDSIAERLRTTVRGGDGSTMDWKRDRLVAETELKLLAAWAPKRYGARIEAEHNLGNMDVTGLSSRVCAAAGQKTMQSIFNAPPLKASDVEARRRSRPRRFRRTPGS